MDSTPEISICEVCKNSAEELANIANSLGELQELIHNTLTTTDIVPSHAVCGLQRIDPMQQSVEAMARLMDLIAGVLKTEAQQTLLLSELQEQVGLESLVQRLFCSNDVSKVKSGEVALF